MSMIRKGTYNDIAKIAKIYEHILEEQEEGKAVTGWVRGVYPTKRTALEALEAGELFVLEAEGRVAAAAKINQIQVPEYADASWAYPDIPEREIMVLHTLVVDPSCAGRGYGTEFVRFYERYARENGCCCLRMDTNANNKAARRLYKHLGYREAGTVPCVFNKIPDVRLVCLEKMLMDREN